jgi:isopenicillin N synthase-like dioxygenase
MARSMSSKSADGQMAQVVPLIDLRSTNAADEIAHAYRQWGFAQLLGHGLDDVLTRMAGAANEFHDLPESTKLQQPLDANHRGYIAASTSTDRASELGAADTPNLSSSFMLMRDAGPDDPDVGAGVYLAGANQWPPVNGFRPIMEQAMGALQALARTLLPMVLGPVASPEVQAAFGDPTLWLRLIRYPEAYERAAVKDEERQQFGSAPHVDFGALTLLSQDDVDGLEVLSPDGEWIPVPPRGDALVMNTGEMVHRWTNGEVRATPHRVVNASGRQRDSMAFFFDPAMAATIQPVGGPEPARFEPIRFEAYVRRQLQASYDAHGATD